MLEDAGGRWRTLEDAGGRWRTLEDLQGATTVRKNRIGLRKSDLQGAYSWLKVDHGGHRRSVDAHTSKKQGRYTS